MPRPRFHPLRLFPAWRRREREQEELRRRAAQAAEWDRFVPPGHFYSPIPSPKEVAAAFTRDPSGPPFAGIDLNEAAQWQRLAQFADWYDEQPFVEEPAPGHRFYLSNPSYGAFDALMLYGMLREVRPARIIEVGSGHSTAAMLDLNDRVLGNGAALTVIDPDFSRLHPLLRDGDTARLTLINRLVQDVPTEVFTSLTEGDVLFVDSSHVSKLGSDVNHLFFEVFPRLAPGVLIHLHDITGNLEYPRKWFDEGRAWNEIYLLRAFLMHNPVYRIELFSAWLFNQRPDYFREHLPRCLKGGGGQLWMRKLR